MNSSPHPARDPHAHHSLGLLHGLATIAAFLSGRKVAKKSQEAWNHWVFLRLHGYEVRISGPGVPTDREALAEWHPSPGEITTLEFHPSSLDETDETGPVSPGPHLSEGAEALMARLGPILASEEIRWVPDKEDPNPSGVPELLAKRFVAEKVIQDFDLAERFFRQAVSLEPTNAELLGQFALFLHEVKRDGVEAETVYRLAVGADPDHATNLANFAAFLHDVRRAPDEAEQYYRQAMKLDPQNAVLLSNMALFLHEIRGHDEQADALFRRARRLDDDQDASVLGNYAFFLHNSRRDDDLAENLYRRALALDGQDANSLGNFALFLKNVRHDHNGAERYFREALRVDPHHSAHLGNFALFMKNIRHDYDAAEEYYHRALEADPHDSNHLGNFALFMKNLRRNHEVAEELFRRSLHVEPDNIHRLGNFVQLLLCQGRHQEGLPLLDKALELLGDSSPVLSLELWFYVLAHDTRRFDQALSRLKKLILAGARSPGWDLRCNCQRAVKDGHAEPELLATLAEIICGDGDIEDMKAFLSWNHAKPA
ncbi:MAG: hypothetical protein H7834_09675 [Magnetococcus sp. YQC-9]